MNTTNHYAVESVYRPESMGGWQSTNIGWDDFTRMSTHVRKLSANRRIETPVWAMNDALLRKVLVRYCENRAGYRCPQPGTDEERIARAQKTLDASLPWRSAILKRLCAEYSALKKSDAPDKKRLKRLEQDIAGADTTIIANRNIALLVTSVVYRYYRLGEDSVGVSQALPGIRPPLIRQILWRLAREWERLQKPQIVRATTPFYLVDTKRAAELRAAGLTYKQIEKELSCKNVLMTLKLAGLWVPAKWLSPAEKRAKLFAKWRAAGRSYARIARRFGLTETGVVSALRRAGLWQRRPPKERVYVKHPKERPLVIPRRGGGKYSACRRAVKKHVAIMERLVLENGGQLPSASWMNAHGHFTSYQYVRRFPNAFRHLSSGTPDLRK